MPARVKINSKLPLQATHSALLLLMSTMHLDNKKESEVLKLAKRRFSITEQEASHITTALAIAITALYNETEKRNNVNVNPYVTWQIEQMYILQRRIENYNFEK